MSERPEYAYRLPKTRKLSAAPMKENATFFGVRLR